MHCVLTRFRQVLGILLMCSIMLWPLVAFVQEVPLQSHDAVPDDDGAVDADRAVQLEEIVITGSRIRRVTYETPQPVQTMTSEDFADRGSLTVGDALDDLAVVGLSNTAESDQASQNVGRQFANLFNLGSQRTLTLVNGRRFVSSNPASAGNTANLSSFAAPGNQVDLNNIASGLIDRVEIVQATGSSVYGSDAIAGVINIILKQDFEGIEADVQFGAASGTGGYGTSRYRITAGHNFSGDRGNIAFNYERSETDDLAFSDRPSAAIAYFFAPNSLDTGRADGIPAAVLIENFRLAPATPGGLPFITPVPFQQFVVTIPDPADPAARVPAQFGPDGNLVPFDPGVGFGPVVASGGDGFNIIETLSISTPVERDVINLIGYYDLTDSVTLRAEGMASWINATEPVNTSGSNSVLFSEAPGNALFVTVDNPFLSDQARGLLVDQGVGGFFLSRIHADLAPNRAAVESETETQRGVLGLEGDFTLGGRNAYWSMSGSYAHTGGSTKSLGLVEQRFLNAFDVVLGPGGEIMCRISVENPGSTDPDIAGCAPLNLFGAGAPSLAAQGYVNTEFREDFDIYQTVLEGGVGGTIASLPGGNLGFAAGLEYRKERSEVSGNEANRLGIGRSVSLAETSGSYDTREIYGELLIPVVGGEFTLPLVQSLELTVSGRYVDNSITGSNNAWSLGAQWRLNDDVMLRVSKSSTFRAPAILELFSPRTTTRGAGIDPCDNRFINTGNNPATRQANCAALFESLGLPANFQLDSNVVSVAVDITTGGNPDLDNEVAESWSAGLVLTPSFMPGFTLTADVLKVTIKDAISNFNITSILSSCFDAPLPDPDICGRVRRDANAQVVDAESSYVNASFTKFEGVSIAVDYQVPLDKIGFLGPSPGRLSLGVNALNTRVLETSVSGQDFDLDKFAGEIGTPEWKTQINLRYQKGVGRFVWTTNFISQSVFDINFTIEDREILDVDRYFTHDASFTWDVLESFTANLGVRNMFDEEPPFPVSLAGSYDIIGRFYYGGVTLRF